MFKPVPIYKVDIDPFEYLRMDRLQSAVDETNAHKVDLNADGFGSADGSSPSRPYLSVRDQLAILDACMYNLQNCQIVRHSSYDNLSNLTTFKFDEVSRHTVSEPRPSTPLSPIVAVSPVSPVLASAVFKQGSDEDKAERRKGLARNYARKARQKKKEQQSNLMGRVQALHEENLQLRNLLNAVLTQHCAPNSIKLS